MNGAVKNNRFLQPVFILFCEKNAIVLFNNYRDMEEIELYNEREGTK